MINKIFFSLLAIFFLGCREKPSDSIHSAEQSAVDSFEIRNINSLSEFLTFQKLNDSTFRSMNLEAHELTYYSKKKGSGFIRADQKKIQPGGYIPCFFTNGDNISYSINEDGVLYKYDKNFNITDTILFTYNLPWLKDNFCFYSYNSSPLIIIGDTVIGSISYKNRDGYSTWFREAAIMEFLLKGDSMQNIQYYLPKPRGLEKSKLPWPTYCYSNNTIALLYPCIDTLYTYDRRLKRETKIALNNPHYKMPAEYKPKGFGDFSYDTKYELANFRYEAIYFNELTQHYIIIFKLPAENKDKSKTLTFEDQHRGALIMDQEFNVVSTVQFEKHYFEPANYFFIPGRGLAMPVFKNKNEYENTMFYIYNF
jgi:hypothetical protein